jgi:hypothetical protein
MRIKDLRVSDLLLDIIALVLSIIVGIIGIIVLIIKWS